ncbi:glycosyltransferase [Gammaproteobacteria bacterium LSUCC0112]|nr:glycosyltransferase [Gammaproteobacteria bacterium LSUCC0112]
MEKPLRSEKGPALISIICRSVNRPTLAQTLNSICSQGWKNIELVLVDALGTGAITVPALPAHVSLRVVCTGKQLDRPKAANAGLKAAQGDYLLFLDDDDWIDAGHLQSLMSAMLADPAVNVVYSATQMVDEQGTATKDVIAVPFDLTRLRRDNFIPIHAALFSRELLDLGCCFDESLPIYEDWDFWLQCAEHTGFTLINNVGAYYRMGGDSRTMLEQHQQRYQAGHPSADARARLLEKWRLRWSGAQWNALLGLIDQTPALTKLHDELGESHHLLETRTTELNKTRNQLEQVQAKLKAKQAEFLTLQRNLADLRGEADLLSASANTLQENNLTLHAEIASLQRGTELLRQDISALHSDKQQLTSVIEQLQSELELSYTALNQANEHLTSTQTSLVVTKQELSGTQAQLEQKISELENAKVTLAHTTQQLQHIEHTLQLLQSDYISLNLAHEQLDRGVREILNSFSWRVTAPYRWLRHRLKKLVAAVLPRRGSVLPSTVHQHSIQAGIVSPVADNSVLPDHFTVQAWAWSNHPVSRVQIFVDQDLFHDIQPLPAHERLEDAQRIGFARLISTTDLTPGPHQLSLVASDDQGQQIRISRHFVFQPSATVYQRWLRDTTPDVEALRAQSQTPVPANRSFTILVHVDESIGTHAQQVSALRATLVSLAAQTCSGFECLISAPASDQSTIRELMSTVLPAASIISPTEIWPALQSTQSTAVCLLVAGETLRSDCLWRVAFAWQDNTVLLYTDHDLIDNNGHHQTPWFTTDWSPDLLCSQNYIGDVFFAATRHLAALDPVNSQADSWRFAVLLDLGTQCSFTNVLRIADILWSAPEHTAAVREYQLAAESLILTQHFEKHARPAQVQRIAGSECRRVQWSQTDTPLVSIIIPTTGNMRFLKPCLDTLKTSTYPAIEVIILDNSRGNFPDGIRYAHEQGAVVIDCNEAFNWSRLNNIGVENSHGELLLFLNDDIEIIQPDWLEELVAQASRDDVGTVGALLLYPNGAIQHGGVFLVDHGGGARHLFHKQLPGKGIYHELDNCVREVSGNTGACQMIRRDRFEQLGRFDEQLSIVGNDIDLCMRALEAGLRNVWTPHSRLIHHESVSRQSKPIGQDERAMWDRWQHRFLGGDPYFNPNIDLTREDYVLAPVPASVTAPASQAETTGVVEEAAVANHNSGVHLIAYIRASMGVGEAARGNAAALEASGVPFGILNYEKGNPSRMDNLRWQHREISSPQYGINLIHINADHTPGVMKDLGKTWFGEHYNIGFWAWEMPEFPDRWLESFDLLDEVWVPSAYVNQAVAAKSPIPVVTIPHIINVDMNGAHLYSRAYFGIPDTAFVFISMFDTHSIAQRKNPFGSIMAFQKAFEANDSSVLLLIKINNADEGSLKVLRSLVGDYQNIVLLDTHYDRAQIDSLINCCDCYVSLHHAEGFGLGPAEAMSLGKVALLTGWSGNTEYMRSNNCVAIQYTLKTLGKDYGPYEAHQHWAVPDVDHAAHEMRDLARNPARVKALGEQAHKTIHQEFSAAAVGERMRQRLQSIERIISRRRTQQ